MGDLRTKRTYKLLQDSLFTLLTKKPFDEIKVNDICDLAMIHRTTFYTHFSDKYELLDYTISEVEKEITSNLKPYAYSNIEDFYTNMIMSVLNYIEEHRKFFRSIMKKNENTGFLKLFHRTCVSYMQEMLKKEEETGIIHTVPIELISEFYSGAVISTIDWWVKTSSKLSKEELCKHITTLIFETPHA